MKINPAKPASESKTYKAAGFSKWLSVAIAILGSISGASFLGAPLLNQFMSEQAANKVLAANTLVVAVLGGISASQSRAAQTGRLYSDTLVYTGLGEKGLKANAPTVVIPETKEESDRLAEFMPYIKGEKQLTSGVVNRSERLTPKVIESHQRTNYDPNQDSRRR